MKYEVTNSSSYRVNDDGSREIMANFAARITEETRYVDGRTTDTFLTIDGEQMQVKDEATQELETVKLPEVVIPVATFLTMQWPMSLWGVRALVYPGSGIKDDLRTAIQLVSKPTIRTVYRHLGWTDINGKPTYIHAGGGIHPKGNDPSITVQLPPEMSRYNLADTAGTLKEDIMATLNLVRICPPEIGWTLLAGTLAPLHGPVDFAIHVTGKTGTYKSELLSLFQSHFGSGMDARHLPGSWSSTPNAIEAQAYVAKNAPYVLDDFVPGGTSSQIRSYQQNADKVIRGQGNQAGRSRLTDTSNLQATMYPRGIILSTGEDTPEGHSVRARMMILELTPGDITPAELTQAQKVRKLYPGTVAAYIQDIAKNPRDITENADLARDSAITVGHARTPSMIGRLQAVIEDFLTWCTAQKVSTKGMHKAAFDAILAAGTKQPMYLEAADPCDQFLGAVRNAFASGIAHARTLNGGVPRGADQMGWTKVDDGSGNDTPNYKSHGPCIGWVSWQANEFYLEPNIGFATAKKAAAGEMALTKQTLLKRLKDDGKIKRTDENRQRNTVRVTAEGHQRQVICLPLDVVLDNKETQADA